MSEHSGEELALHVDYLTQCVSQLRLVVRSMLPADRVWLFEDEVRRLDAEMGRLKAALATRDTPTDDAQGGRADG